MKDMTDASNKISSALEQYGIASLEEAETICKEKGLNIYEIVRDVQPICFENACWAYLVGAAIAIKKGQTQEPRISHETLGDWFTGLLHSGFRCGRPEGGSRARQPGLPCC